jgi:hypothetical protein
MMLEKALQNLCPNVAWTLPGEAILANVVWPDGFEPPAAHLVDAEIERLLIEKNRLQQYQLAKIKLADHLNRLAQSWEYESYDRAGIYCTSKNNKYRAEAQAIIDYGSDCFAISDGIRAGEIPEPASVEAFMALLPPLPARPTVTA